MNRLFAATVVIVRQRREPATIDEWVMNASVCRRLSASCICAKLAWLDVGTWDRVRGRSICAGRARPLGRTVQRTGPHFARSEIGSTSRRSPSAPPTADLLAFARERLWWGLAIYWQYASLARQKAVALMQGNMPRSTQPASDKRP